MREIFGQGHVVPHGFHLPGQERPSSIGNLIKCLQEKRRCVKLP